MSGMPEGLTGWDPARVAALTPREREVIARHERLHVEHARARGHMTVLEYQEATLRIRAFERGDEIADPGVRETFRAAYNADVDRRVEEALRREGKI